jgi:hypothetical protein
MEPYFQTSLAPEHDYFALVLKVLSLRFKGLVQRFREI